MANWSPEQWAIFFGSLSLLITTAITPLVNVWMSNKTNKKVDASTAVSLENNESIKQVGKAAVVAAIQAEETKKVAAETKQEILKAVKNGHT